MGTTLPSANQKRVVCFLLPQPKEENFLALAEACYRFTPQIAVRANEAIFLEITACRNLYTVEGLRARLSALAQRMGHAQHRIAVAESAAAALAQARYGVRYNERSSAHARASAQNRAGTPAPSLAQLPLQALTDYASPFLENPDLNKKISQWIRVLELLGLQSLDDFARLPSSSLASRFGKEAIELAARVRGQFSHAWPGFHPEPRVTESIQLDESAENLEALIFLLKSLADRVMARLRGRGERLSRLAIRVELEKWSSLKTHQKTYEIALPVPQGSAAGLIPILKDYLDRKVQSDPIPAPIQAAHLEVLETVPGVGAQRDFFNKKEEESEAWNALVGLLSQKLGKERVFLALPVERYLPEKAWVKNLNFTPEKSARSTHMMTPTASPRRPVRILRKPEPLGRKGHVLIHPTGKSWKIREWDGPERLSGEWWSQRFTRDYYRIQTENGEQLWVFLNRESETPVLYLHGYFD